MRGRLPGSWEMAGEWLATQLSRAGLRDFW